MITDHFANEYKVYKTPYYNTVLCSDESSIFITKIFNSEERIFQPKITRGISIENPVEYNTILVIEPFISKENICKQMVINFTMTNKTIIRLKGKKK
jgi:hypothetical protein